VVYRRLECALDGTVEVGAFGRQDDEFEDVGATMVLEGRRELGSTIDLDAFDRKRSGGDELGKEGFGGVSGCARRWKPSR
jgi:hypothetical protein